MAAAMVSLFYIHYCARMGKCDNHRQPNSKQLLNMIMKAHSGSAYFVHHELIIFLSSPTHRHSIIFIFENTNVGRYCFIPISYITLFSTCSKTYMCSCYAGMHMPTCNLTIYITNPVYSQKEF